MSQRIAEVRHFNPLFREREKNPEADRAGEKRDRRPGAGPGGYRLRLVALHRKVATCARVVLASGQKRAGLVAQPMARGGESCYLVGVPGSILEIVDHHKRNTSIPVINFHKLHIAQIYQQLAHTPRITPHRGPPTSDAHCSTPDDRGRAPLQLRAGQAVWTRLRATRAGNLAPYHMARFLQSAFRHGLTAADLQRVLANPSGSGPWTTRRGENGAYFVGPTTSRGLALVLTESRGGDVVVYHAHFMSRGEVRRFLRR